MEGQDGHRSGGVDDPLVPSRRRGSSVLLASVLMVTGTLVLVHVVHDRGADPGPGPTDAAAPAVLVEEREWVARAAKAAPTPPSRPNVVLITADDMAVSDLRWMPITRRLLGDRGVELTNFLSNHPLCCPARAEILTGQYAHNNGVHDNDGSYGGYQALRRPHQTIGLWMRRAGYRTAFVGKYLNWWELDPRPESGWTVFNPLVRNVYRYFGYTLYRDGSPRTYRHAHSNDVIGRFTRRYIERFSRDGSPFFVWAAPVAPHNRKTTAGWRPPAAAARHRGLYQDAVAPNYDHPAFNEPDVSDKPPHLTHRSPMPLARARIDHRARIRSLRSLDEQVRRTVRTLRATGELEDTYVLFTSDNGYLLGEHRMHGKNLPYEESLRVPLLVRGPRLPAGVVRRGQYGLVDLAPTFLDVARASAGRRVDGRSMLSTLRSGGGAYRHYLIQASTRDVAWWWRGVRSNHMVYVRYAGGFEELYDLRRDPAQLLNVAQDPGYADARARFARRLERLQTCAGRTCWSGSVASAPTADRGDGGRAASP